jgi:molybdopterin synthase sulfur carrier subunit
MNISVRLFTTLREISGKRKVVVSFEKGSATIMSVLVRLAELFGKEFKDYLFTEEGAVRGHLSILVNGKGIGRLEEFETKLNEGDQVAIVPPVGGG